MTIHHTSNTVPQTMSAVFRFELKFWLMHPATYGYALLFFLLSLATMGGMAGDSAAYAGKIVNSPAQITDMINFFTQLMLFLLPAVIGAGVYRDFRSNIHTVLYAFPLPKGAYLPAKFSAAFMVVILIVAAIAAGLLTGTALPGVDGALLGPFNLWAYLQPYALYVLPNMLMFGAIVFAVVITTRNIYAGFAAIILLFLIQGILNTVLSGLDNTWFAALLDPFGAKAGIYHTRYWTVAEKNTRLLPVSGLIIANRAIWLAIAIIVSAAAYRAFHLHHSGPFAGISGRKSNHTRQINYPGITQINSPPVSGDFSFGRQWGNIGCLVRSEIRYILRSGTFIGILIAGIVLICLQQTVQPLQYGFRILPVTWQMLRIPVFLFSGVIYLLTFLYAGMLVHRARIARMDQLIDSTPVPDWCLPGAKTIALVLMQALLLCLIMVGGILVQAGKGYYHFEVDLYLFELFVLKLPSFVIWALAAIFVHTLFNSPYPGFFLLLVGFMGVGALPEIGIDHPVFRFGMAPAYSYSDMDGYGHSPGAYLLYEYYWLMGGGLLFIGALLGGRRGFGQSFGDRLRIARRRFRGPIAVAAVILSAGFLGMGFFLYYDDVVRNEKISGNMSEARLMALSETRYKQYEQMPQPAVTDVSIALDLFPETRDFTAAGSYLLVNTSRETIDTLLVHYSFDEKTRYRFSRPAQLCSRDTLLCFDILTLSGGLAPGDSLTMTFVVRNGPHTVLQNNSPVLNNGTYFDNRVFPGLGYRGRELTNTVRRAKFGLPARTSANLTTPDSSALSKAYSGHRSPWIHFEATISTAPDQIALAPGYLQAEWTANGRRYFRYKMNRKIKHYYGFCSGRFAVERDRWRDIDLEIYYHPGHQDNLSRMMKGLKGSLSYNTRNFGPYRHRQSRIIEFPKTIGTHATTFANSIPFSEVRFLIAVDEGEAGRIDFPFYAAAHEMAHQWWGNQLLPADVPGAKMLTESLAEYSALNALEKEYGRPMVHQFLKYNLDLYLKGRAAESETELPLMFALPHQNYITYRKGALVFYTLRDYIGEDKLNAALRAYLEKVRFQEAPFTTSGEFLAFIKPATPDSLQYVLTDMFAAITLYDNSIGSARLTALADGRYRVEAELIFSKYRRGADGGRIYADKTGRTLSFEDAEMQEPVFSLPLADYIDLAIFAPSAENDAREPVALYRRKLKVEQISKKLSVIVDRKPAALCIDPNLRLIDRNVADNRRDF